MRFSSTLLFALTALSANAAVMKRQNAPAILSEITAIAAATAKVQVAASGYPATADFHAVDNAADGVKDEMDKLVDAVKAVDGKVDSANSIKILAAFKAQVPAISAAVETIISKSPQVKKADERAHAKMEFHHIQGEIHEVEGQLANKLTLTADQTKDGLATFKIIDDLFTKAQATFAS